MAERARGPQFVRYFGPILDALRELGGSARPSEVEGKIIENLRISEVEQNEQTKSGQSRFTNQVHWARFYLSRGGFLESSSRGVWSLTEHGQASQLSHAEALTIFTRVHSTLPKNKKHSESESVDDIAIESEPEQSIAATDYRAALLEVLKALPPAGFEKICQRMLRESGFQEVTVTGRSGDGGIDGHGVLQLNPFVSVRVLFQCKRYQGSVGAPHVRDFRGGMQGRAEKGIIITTGTYTPEARREAIRDGVDPIELVDGDRLVTMFESLELGLRPVKTYAIDERFFDEFR